MRELHALRCKVNGSKSKKVILGMCDDSCEDVNDGELNDASIRSQHRSSTGCVDVLRMVNDKRTTNDEGKDNVRTALAVQKRGMTSAVYFARDIEVVFNQISTHSTATTITPCSSAFQILNLRLYLNGTICSNWCMDNDRCEAL